MQNRITFLGTAGARIMVANQIQASGGIWLDFNGTQILLDPGPGSIVQSIQRKFQPEQLKAIILSHRHLDHSGDMNIMVESMTQGGFKPHGRVFLPSDALGKEPVLYSYLLDYLDGVEILKEGHSYKVDGVSFSTPLRHHHAVETYGLKFEVGGHSFSYIADSKYLDALVESYRSELLIINVVFLELRWEISHLSMADVEKIITGIRPKVAILTHFGLQMWKSNPDSLAEKLSQKIGIDVRAAHDGLEFDLTELEKA
jgi:ribonuclease BN (tRNA processing enzyme)